MLCYNILMMVKNINEMYIVQKSEILLFEKKKLFFEQYSKNEPFSAVSKIFHIKTVYFP